VNSASVYLACQLDFPAQVLSANVCLLTRSMPRVLFRGEACLWHTQYNPTRRRSQSSDCHWAQTFPKAIQCTENTTNAGQKQRIVHFTLAAAFGKEARVRRLTRKSTGLDGVVFHLPPRSP
jgi:hypothetical protein